MSVVSPNDQTPLPTPLEIPASAALPAVHRRIGDVLVAQGKATPQQVERALSVAKATGSTVGTALVKLGFISERTLGEGLAELHGLTYISLADQIIDPSVLTLLPEHFIRRHLVFPIRQDIEQRRLEIAMAHPNHLSVLNEVSLHTGLRPIPRVSTINEILTAIDRFYSHHGNADDALARLEEDLKDKDNVYSESISDELESEIADDEAPIVQLVNSILMEAIQSNASDVHMEPQKERLLVRYRIDGILREVRSIPKTFTLPVISRVKVASGMDIAERRRPQDGRMKLPVGSQLIDMRVNTLAVQFGEKVVIRILKPTATAGGLEKLGMAPDEKRLLYKMIKSPNGVILVTGPTGSGKTTTLYGCLREISTPEINITTIEDPIEYPMVGVNQTQISHKSGLTFARCLRAILRQDPDVILVGEIRDEETLEAAIHAAMTGHLVFSTIHTNSAAKTVSRLLEMGADPYMVSSTVIGIMAQRLVRQVCPSCKEAYEATPDELEILGMTETAEQPVTLYRGTGCAQCDQSGYQGRIALYEIMELTRDIQILIDQRASIHTIEDQAIQNGMRTLAMDGKRKILAGLTTVQDVCRVLGLDLKG